MHYLIISLVFAQLVSGLEYSSTVKTKFGSVRGLLSEPFYDYNKGERAEVFLGLPYALPPIGSLRFEKPQPYNLTWLHEREATQFGPGCVPLINIYGLPADEDCLTLNIFRPHPTKRNEKKPVLVYVHGGGFAFGSSLMYNYNNLSSNFVSRDIIVITINYRLGVYGFTSTGDENLPGNLGLWDQAMAFKWIHENIDSFGGDPNRVTAWGLSAGAASVGLLTLSPHSQKYIAQTIEMSGPALSEWAVSDETIDYTYQFAANIGCPTENSKDIKECLLSKSQEFIVQSTLTFTKPTPKLLQFTPRIDGDFLPEPLDELIQKAPKIKSLSGVTETEVLYFTILNKDMPINAIAVSPSRFHNYDRQDLESYVTHFSEYLTRTFGDHKQQIHDATVEFYTRGAAEFEKTTNYSYFYLNRFNELTSDFFFNIPALFLARARTAYGSDSFVYVNSYFNEEQFPSEIPLKAATHANSYPYMNGLFPVGEFEFNDKDREFQNLVADVLVRFTKEGRPTADWRPITVDSINHGHIDRNGDLRQINHAPFKEAYEFWKEMNDFSKNGIFKVSHQTYKKIEL
ncbi:Carboxylic ester hydrolase [Aphelenchoides besseyi]|nr:Carboxylic ester hydrolase [Aphelenchoides besseyi]KAI6237741.1 Carboxylic ester hydrolase [Aphelenchoides besseyi]